jgi:NADH:ubiquinone reductase (H+-translocating)
MSAMLADTRLDKAPVVVEAPRPGRKRVVIVVGGFAGIAAARALRHADVGVVLSRHYAFHVSDAEFNAIFGRIREASSVQPTCL